MLRVFQSSEIICETITYETKLNFFFFFIKKTSSKYAILSSCGFGCVRGEVRAGITKESNARERVFPEFSDKNLKNNFSIGEGEEELNLRLDSTVNKLVSTVPPLKIHTR